MKIIIFHCIQFMDSPAFGHVDVAAIGHQKTHSPVSAHKQSWLSHQIDLIKSMALAAVPGNFLTLI